ncbi:hypothetical protein BU23DRAFT_551163 [Bimuria novae-zelandiae CBS 107.79]|uniref:Uncharacterized protein n=1 Tax=Bimuria novae-zelandiae CBS 107.79 TaxID=1447943 RepID=A0A6A5VKP0_9PLEO|nr:hypothetical protein BU23DRAFT_551163 [Bimuria novae-zelandiae CBS 107.79]
MLVVSSACFLAVKPAKRLVLFRLIALLCTVLVVHRGHRREALRLFYIIVLR